MTRCHAVVHTVLGEFTLVADGPLLAGAYADGQAHRPHPASLGALVDPAEAPVLAAAAAQLTEYLEGRRRAFDLPLAAPAGELEGVVREALLAVPFGATTTYGDIAEDLGDRNLAQAVGQAVGRNPYLVIVPCHRVLAADGSLTGYAAGVDRKAFLLDLEQHAVGLTMLPPIAPAVWSAQEAPAERLPQEVEGVVAPGEVLDPDPADVDPELDRDIDVEPDGDDAD